MGNIELFGRDNKVGDKVIIYLNSGKDIVGDVVEIGESYILVKKDDGKMMRLFENIIGAWETVASDEEGIPGDLDQTGTGEDPSIPESESPLSPDNQVESENTEEEAVQPDSSGIVLDEEEDKLSTAEDPQEPVSSIEGTSEKRFGLKILGKIDLSKFNDPRFNKPEKAATAGSPKQGALSASLPKEETVPEQPVVPYSIYDEQLDSSVEKLRHLFERMGLDLSQKVPTNASVVVSDEGSAYWGYGVTDDGVAVSIQKEGFVGDPTILNQAGSRLFCRPQAGQQPLRSFVTLAEMTYENILSYFDQYIKERSIVKAITILKTLRSIPIFEAVDISLRDTYELVKSSSRKAYEDSIVDVLEPSPEEETRMIDFITEMIESEDKDNPVQDIQIRNAYTFKHRVRITVPAFAKAREKAGFPPCELRVTESSMPANLEIDSLDSEDNDIEDDQEFFDSSIVFSLDDESLTSTKDEILDAFDSVLGKAGVKDDQMTPSNAVIISIEGIKITAKLDDGMLVWSNMTSLFALGYNPQELINSRIFCPIYDTSVNKCRRCMIPMSYRQLTEAFENAIENYNYNVAIRIIRIVSKFPEMVAIHSDFSQILSSIRKLRSIKNCIDAQQLLSEKQRNELSVFIDNYIEQHPNDVIKASSLRPIVASELGLKVKGVYIYYLLSIALNKKRRQSEEGDFQYIRDFSQVEESLQALNSRFDIDKDSLLYHMDAVSLDLEAHFEVVDKPNAFVQKVGKNSCTVNYNSEGIRCFYNSVLDFDLLKRLSEFTEGELPVRVSTYVKKKTGETSISNIVDVLSIRAHITKLIRLIEEENYVYARRYNQNIQSLIRPYLSPKGKAHHQTVINILKEASFDISELPIVIINYSTKVQAEQEASKKAAQFVSSSSDSLLSQGKTDDAIETIRSAIETERLLPKEQGVLYQKLIQIYTSADRQEEAIDVYMQWISYGERHNMFTVKKLSRLYTDLARLQYSTPEHEPDALESLRIALEYNPDNKLSLSLQEQITAAIEERENIGGVELQVTPESRMSHSLDVISDMLDLDIQEHKYTDKRIVAAGAPTIEIANNLLDEARSANDVESYPLFLETAKAFHDLKFYNHQDYIFVVANYARLKGNSLFKTFRKNVLSYMNAPASSTSTFLCRLKDSAQSYYMESLNLWSYISFEDEDEDAESSSDSSINQEAIVLEILVNHMILDVAYYHACTHQDSTYNFDSLFNMQFKDVFYNCMRSNDEALHGIAASTIVKVGSYSSTIWNRLASLPNGISGLYGELRRESNRLRFYASINRSEFASITTDLSPKDFLKEAFTNHSAVRYEYAKQISRLKEEVLSPHGMDVILLKWHELSPFNRLLSATDLESSEKVEEILTILKPYPHRNDEERSTLLYQVTEIIDEQIAFINTNTTFYGRTFFYPLLTKWAGEIRSIRKERVASKHPRLSIFPDPSYILNTDAGKQVSLVIKNSGETTAEGFSIVLEFTSHKTDESFEYSNKVKTEIPAGQMAAYTIGIGKELDCSMGINVFAEIAPIYQTNILPSIETNFTLEEEPESLLEPEDIIWSDGPITPRRLFFGRQELINKLEKHYLSSNKHKPYILFGLTRTGKSSIVKYLGLQITGKTVRTQGGKKTVLHFSMDLDDAAKCPNAKEVWEFFIKRCLYKKICEYSSTYSIDPEDFKPSEHPRSYEFEDILNKLNEKGYYPFITMDEFSHMKTLIKYGKLTSAFLHTLRKYAFDGLASFMYIGTYDINDLMNDKEYGITGQLTHCINYQLNEIDELPAKELMNVLGDKLIFTEDAQNYICKLSGRVPYFIQIICQNCGKYAVEKKRRFIGYPELLEVVKILTGETEVYDDDSELQRLTINTFEDNQYSANDPIFVLALVASISYLNRDCDQNNVPPKGIRIDELERLWIDYGIKNAKYYIGEAINILKAKRIIEQNNDDLFPTYTIIVDLYRRWCKVEYPDINLVLSPLLNLEN